MRALKISAAIHLGLVLILILLVNFESPFTETPIEINEIIKTIRPKVTEKAAPKRATQIKKSEPTRPSTSDAPADNPVTDSNEPVAEEYEVSSLPVLVNEVRIPYPPEARAKKIQGAVVFQLIVGSDGRVKSATPLQSPGEALTQAALSAIKNFRFKPAVFKDKPVAIQIQYTYRFVLE